MSRPTASIPNTTALLSSSKCPICLSSPADDLTMVDGCFHQFCFVCILQWSEMDKKCPLCKYRVTRLIHHIDPAFPGVFEVFDFAAKSQASHRRSQALSVRKETETRLRRLLRHQVYAGRLVALRRTVKLASPVPFGPDAAVALPKPQDLKYYQQLWKTKLSSWLELEIPILLHHNAHTDADEAKAEFSLARALIEALVFTYGDLSKTTASQQQRLVDLLGPEVTTAFLADLHVYLCSTHTSPHQYDTNVVYGPPNNAAEAYPSIATGGNPQTVGQFLQSRIQANSIIEVDSSQGSDESDVEEVTPPRKAVQKAVVVESDEDEPVANRKRKRQRLQEEDSIVVLSDDEDGGNDFAEPEEVVEIAKRRKR